MSSKFSNKYPIPENFPSILHDFAREVVRHMPKDILDFAIQYFSSLEQNMPLNYIANNSKKEENKIEDSQEITEIKDKRELITTPSMPTNQNTQNLFFKKSELKEIKEIQKESGEQSINKVDDSNNKLQKTENDKNESVDNKSNSTFHNISGSSDVKNEIRNFIGGLIDESKKNL